ncbi:DUF6455 family protein [Microbacteriaceae bacterium K1510]|nr:DUF6455 family protein [Microbacteriaceae bacterium K1510]
MIRFRKEPVMPTCAPNATIDHARGTAANMAAMTDRLGLGTVPAAWPTGISQLALTINACQRCDAFEVCGDWLARAPKAIAVPPAFCPNAPAFKKAEEEKKKG